MPTPERRRQRRTQVRVPVKVRPENGPEQSAQTRDLSASGIFLYSESALEPGARLELVIMLPADMGFGPGGWTLCQASVVRTEVVGTEKDQSDRKRVGVAATLDRIELLPELS